MAGQVAAEALAQATEANDQWALGWALHVLTITAMMQGRMSDALPLFDRALSVTQADPALTDLRLLLQINQAVTLGDLDKFDSAFDAARQAQRLADRVGIVNRRAQLHSCLSQLLFHSGRWDAALTELGAFPDVTKDPGVACCDHGIAAVICFHRGEDSAARCRLAAAAPHAKQIENRVVGPLALARSLDSELKGEPAEALAELTRFTDNAEEIDEIEDLLPDGVRLAARVGDTATGRLLADRAAGLAHDTEIPHRQANALYCSGLLDNDAGRLLQAAERYHDAGRRLLQAKALEAGAGVSIAKGDRDPGRATVTRAVDIYASLGAARDVARLRALSREHGVRRS